MDKFTAEVILRYRDLDGEREIRTCPGEPLYRQEDVHELPRPEEEQARLLQLPLRVLMGSPFQAAKDEIVWVRGCNSDGTLRYVITSNKTRDRYFLYGLERGKWEKIAKARSPIAFEGRVKLY